MKHYSGIDSANQIGLLLPLIIANGQEVVGPSFNPDISAMCDYIKAGILHVFTVQHGDTYIGYASYAIGTDMLRAGRVRAECQVIYVSPAYRGRTTINLIRFAEERLTSYRVNEILTHTNNLPSLTKMYGNMGYDVKDTIMVKELV